MASLPSNAHVSQHPCLQAKLSQLRSASTSSKDVQALVHDIALMVGYEALAGTYRLHAPAPALDPAGTHGVSPVGRDSHTARCSGTR
jgi:uracil phosphoribosyltransferase